MDVGAGVVRWRGFVMFALRLLDLSVCGSGIARVSRFDRFNDRMLETCSIFLASNQFGHIQK